MTARKASARWIGIASVPLTAMVVTVASSRGGAILTLAIALFMVFRSRIRPWVAFVTAPVVIALLLLGPGAQHLLSRFSNATDMLSVVVRLMYWRVAWHRVLDFWPIGMGWGQGYSYQDRLYDQDPHDYWLVLGSELGLIGLVLWITVLVMVYRRILRIARHPATKAEGQALQLTFWISQLNTLFEPTFQGLQYHFIWYWIMGSYFGWAERTWEQYEKEKAAGQAAGVLRLETGSA
jgi:O-antigen ligase